MELQEFVMKSVVTNVRFPASARFADIRGALADALMASHGLPNWNMAEQFVLVHDEADPSVQVQLSHGEARASFENVDIEECHSQTLALLETAFSELHIEHVNFVGVRSWWIAAADSFEELHTWMLDRLGGGPAELFNPIGHPPSDSGWVFEFRSAQPEHILRLGPMKAEQAMEQIFRDKDAANYPPQFLFMDLDRLYRPEEPFDRGTSMERWEAAFARNIEVAQQLGRIIAS